jgi:dipeptidyl aminopeptidase/acylaminoacyl peptidase
LSDYVDGSQYLVENHGLNLDKIGIYDGSYGGFIALMVMFNETKILKAGDAIGSFTYWANYNQSYISIY